MSAWAIPFPSRGRWLVWLGPFLVIFPAALWLGWTTRIFLKTSEPRAAKWISEAIGKIEVERLKESRSMGPLWSKKSFAMEIATKPLVMASQFAGLPALTGFIKLENHVVQARFRLAKKRNRQPEFVEWVREQPLPRQVAVLETSAPVKAPQVKTPVQAVLPLEEAPAVKREGFGLDDSSVRGAPGGEVAPVPRRRR